MLVARRGQFGRTVKNGHRMELRTIVAQAVNLPAEQQVYGYFLKYGCNNFSDLPQLSLTECACHAPDKVLSRDEMFPYGPILFERAAFGLGMQPDNKQMWFSYLFGFYFKIVVIAGFSGKCANKLDHPLFSH